MTGSTLPARTRSRQATTAASLATSGVVPRPHGTLESKTTVSAGGTVRMGLTGINPDTLTVLGARPARLPAPIAGAVTGLVWRDFSLSNPTNISGVFPDEDGLPNLRLALLRSDGSTAATTTTDAFGQFSFPNVGAGTFRVQILASNFQPGFSGIFWLGPQSLTPTSNLSQTAQALLSVSAHRHLNDLGLLVDLGGLHHGHRGGRSGGARPRGARGGNVDGATDWQTLRRVTIPMLAPVLTVVLVTMVINVLKIFDIVINLGADNSQPGGQASTLASDVYYLGFGGGVHTGLASALAVILFILVIPAMLFNLKRISAK